MKYVATVPIEKCECHSRIVFYRPIENDVNLSVWFDSVGLIMNAKLLSCGVPLIIEDRRRSVHIFKGGSLLVLGSVSSLLRIEELKMVETKLLEKYPTFGIEIKKWVQGQQGGGGGELE